MNRLCLCELQVLRYNLIVPFGRQMCGLKWEKEMDRVNEWSIYLANVYARVGRDKWLEWTCTRSIILVKARAILQLVEKISLESSFLLLFFFFSEGTVYDCWHMLLASLFLPVTSYIHIVCKYVFVLPGVCVSAIWVYIYWQCKLSFLVDSSMNNLVNEA